MAEQDALFHLNDETGAVTLESPSTLPDAGAFLWNRKMLLQVNCRGFANAQFMQPEPAKYSCGPALEAKTFLQPEHHYYPGHPGRFVYVLDHETHTLFSIPFEPSRQTLDSFKFIAETTHIRWEVSHLGWEFSLKVGLSPDDVVEFWELDIHNTRDDSRKLSVYPVFSIGYQSWMNQSAKFEPSLNAIVASKISPYQKVDDYYKQCDFAELTYLLAERPPTSWTSELQSFLGDGGWHAPAALSSNMLEQKEAHYQVPIAAMQYDMKFSGNKQESLRFMFGAAKSHRDIQRLRLTHLSQSGFEQVSASYAAYYRNIQSCVSISTPDSELDHFVNHWLPRQMFYHGDVNRLTTDPQTRNYLQDAMGMSYLLPEVTKKAFVHALSQQHFDGAMPDGILLHPDAELKYINQVPHMDHAVWLPICLRAYLSETEDFGLLTETVSYQDSQQSDDLFTHIDKAMHWLLSIRDDRGLSLISEGDWCDPMNMVGYKGKGVSSWLTLATAWACKEWAEVCQYMGNTVMANTWREHADTINQAVNTHCWSGEWYGRGITDDGRLFGVADDAEGKMFLNPQSWAMLSGAASLVDSKNLQKHISEHLLTPYGATMLAPAFTKMHEDIGRITQKYPGVAENGSVYNHAAAFYAYALYQYGLNNAAFEVLSCMLVRQRDALAKGQLPLFIPNYYRGAYHQIPQTAGRSSHLFNTGTIAWFYRCLLEGTFGVFGTSGGLRIRPQLPSHWKNASLTRRFRGSVFEITFERKASERYSKITVNGKVLDGDVIPVPEGERRFKVEVVLPAATPFESEERT